jgi:hypothetical protein
MERNKARSNARTVRSVFGFLCSKIAEARWQACMSHVALVNCLNGLKPVTSSAIGGSFNELYFIALIIIVVLVLLLAAVR